MCNIVLVKFSKQPTFDVEHLQNNYLDMAKSGEEEGKGSTKILEIFGMTSLYIGQEREEGLACAFLVTSQVVR
jgi:hypothetical protein